ncbi:hypothetical protein P154DRAFT_64050 [Amniculicola lignicola CBS 123094]|uniref:Uncharacterized protein n=1 Tax=Amniculicola lignicola CBS 123094 TaxID=1392246 RepID=A0A6A5WR30_9PLEO|nr:hypothetical protein P154DRAFT_64050 [Amniculicola lignicola CBS 123094]
MTPPFDCTVLRVSRPAEVARHFQKIQLSTSSESSTEQLLQAIERGSVRPNIFPIWLSTSRSPIALKQALGQKFSLEVRYSGLIQLKNELKSHRWKATWDALGGIRGLLELCSDFSVQEIRKFCKVILVSSRGRGLEEKRKMFTDLVRSLQPLVYPEVEFKSLDNRPLGGYFRMLIPGCSSDFIVAMVEETCQENKVFTSQERAVLLQYHIELLRSIVFQDQFKNSAEASRFRSELFRCYPSAPGDDDGFSASMQFSLSILRKLCDEETMYGIHSAYLSDLVEPLLRKVLRKKITWIRKKEICDLVLRYLEKYPKEAKKVTWNNGTLIRYVVVCWAHRADWFEQHLITLIQYANKYSRKAWLKDYSPLMLQIAKTKRYQFLRLCIKTTNQVDIESDSDLKQFPQVWGPLLLQDLDVENSLHLLRRLRKARGSQALISQGAFNSVTSTAMSWGSSYGDVDVLELLLTQQNGNKSEAEEMALPLIKGRKRKAATEPDQACRAFYAKSVLHLAIASGSLAISKDVVVWLRRFVKDPLTVPVLFQDYAKEAIDMLCGIPKNSSGELDPKLIHTTVQNANEVLWILFETVILALREPSFAVYHWQGTLNLFSKTVDLRMKEVEYLESKMDIASAQVYEIVWEDTLKLLLKVEEECLKPDHGRLGKNTVKGVFRYPYSSLIVTKASLSTYQFFDNFARARDELWQKVRLTNFPAVATLPAPYPRGLPLQHLTGPYEVIAVDLDAVCPYLASRVQSVVYLNPTAALAPVPADQETRQAIGLFVDDYDFALGMYIPEALDSEEKKGRISRAWTHIVDKLNKPRMTDAEGLRYWSSGGSSKFMEWRREHGLVRVFDEWPVIPSVEDPKKAEEWNPLPPKKEDILVRILRPLTYLDLANFIGNKNRNPTVDTEFVNFKAQVPAETYPTPNIWEWSRLEQAKRFQGVVEGQILSAILFLDSLNAAKERLVTRPFPGDQDVRYPSLYLDEEFLSRRDLFSSQAIPALQEHIKSVPPNLLAELAERTIAALKPRGSESNSVSDDTMAFQLLVLLTKSDRPSLASELVVRTILQRPDASAWHRSLLAPGFFKRLSASDARACFKAFASGIMTTLQTQEELKPKASVNKETGSEESSKNAAEKVSGPFVKVTTIKFLAQLLHNAEFVSEEFSIAILSELAKRSSHLDVRQAVLSSFLNMLRTATEQQAEKILNALEVFIPVAGNLNERRPLTEEDWTTASKSLTPPLVDGTTTDVPAILDAIVRFRMNAPTDFPHMDAYTSRILLPIFARLQQENARWIKIFLLSHNIPEADHESLKIPYLPRNERAWRLLLTTGTSYLPVSILDEYNRWVTFNMAPPAQIATLNKTLTDPALYSVPANYHWLSLYNHNRDITYHTLDVEVLLEAVPESPKADSEITLTLVQQHILAQWTVILLHDSPHYKNLHMEIESLRPSTFSKLWIERCRPVMEAIVLYIERMRSMDWERNHKRRPTVLPDLWEQRLWLLSYPSRWTSGEEEEEGGREERCKRFAGQVDKLIDRITGTAYHGKYAKIKETLQFLKGKDRLLVSLYLGDVGKGGLSWVTVRDLLRVELAVHLLDGVKIGQEMEDEGLRARLEVLKRGWRESENEEVRRMGWGLQD